MISNAAKAGTENPLWYGYPPWIVVLVGAVVATAGLWLFAKIVKWLLVIAMVVVLVGGLIWAAKLYLG